jgi:hypothetical protein
LTANFQYDRGLKNKRLIILCFHASVEAMAGIIRSEQ